MCFLGSRYSGLRVGVSIQPWDSKLTRLRQGIPKKNADHTDLMANGIVPLEWKGSTLGVGRASNSSSIHDRTTMFHSAQTTQAIRRIWQAAAREAGKGAQNGQGGTLNGSVPGPTAMIGEAISV